MTSLKRPNVLIIYTDQQRWDSLRCYGNQLAITPNLDRLAERGARLDKYFVQNPVCMPSRMSFLTGRYCGSLGIGVNGIPFPEDAIPVNQLLKPYGYHTAQIGKLHFQPHVLRDHKDPHPTYGFDTFILSDEPGCYDDAYTKWVEMFNPDMVDRVRISLPPAAYQYNKPNYSDVPRNTHEPYIFEGEEEYTHSSFVASETCSFIRGHKHQTFFAIAGLYAPHAPLNPPKRFVEMYNPDDFELPKIGKDEVILDFLKDVPQEKWKETNAYYMALVSHVDDCVGQMMKTLEEEGIFDDTLIVFTTDHGEFLGDHGKIQKGMPGHDCIVRVPCIISYPKKIKAGTVIEELIEAVDIVPTLLDYCGIQTSTFIQGKSIKGLLEGCVEKHKEDILVEHFTPFGCRETTVRTSRYKYYCNTEGGEILYDLEKDPFELENVVSSEEYAQVLSDMRKRMLIRIQTAAYRDLNRIAEY